MARRTSVIPLQRFSFAFMAIMVNLFNYSTNPVLKGLTNSSVLLFIVLVLVSMRGRMKVSLAFLPYYFFLAFCCISVLISTSVSDSIGKIKTLIIIQFELLAVYHFTSKEEELGFALNTIALCTIVTALFILSHGVTILKTALRVGYVTGDSNQSSAYLAYGIAILLLYFFKQKKFRWLLAIGILASILAIILQGSRASAAVAGFVLLFETVLLMRYERMSRVTQLYTTIILLIFLAVCGYFIMHNPTLYKTLGRRLVSFYEIQSGGQSSINEMSTFNRILSYKLALNRFLTSPFFGNGIASFEDYAEQYMGRKSFCPNNYLELLQGVGFMGTILYYMVYLYILRSAMILYKRRGSVFSVVALTVILAMLLEHITVVFYYHKLEYLFLGVLLSIVSLQRGALESRGSHDTNVTRSLDKYKEGLQDAGTIEMASYQDRRAGPIGHTGRLILPKHIDKGIDD